MSPDNFSTNFDILFNNVMSNAAPGLDLYEKSYLLTKAQEEVLKNHLNPAGNKYRQGFDDSSKRQLDFSRLTIVETLTPVTVESSDITFSKNILKYAFPTNIMSVINEQLLIKNTDTRQVIPMSYEEYQRIMAKPYHYPAKRQAWRIIDGSKDINTLVPTNRLTVELILTPSDYKRVTEGEHPDSLVYKMLYIRRPKPIILTNLHSEFGNDVDIEGCYKVQGCELEEVLHEEILQRAVEIAKAAYGSDVNGQLQLQNQITTGQRSE